MAKNTKTPTAAAGDSTKPTRAKAKATAPEQADLFSAAWAEVDAAKARKNPGLAAETAPTLATAQSTAQSFAQSTGQSTAQSTAQPVASAAAAITAVTRIEVSPDDAAMLEKLAAENLAEDLQVGAMIDDINQSVQALPRTPEILSVSDIAGDIRDTLKGAYGEILVQGEVADFKGIHRSGHLYFALKDSKSAIRAVMWKGALQKVPFDIKGGMEVIVAGRLDFYPASGSLQIVVERMEPLGVGALQLKFEQLKEKLRLEGLFDTAKKRVVPPLNWRIGIITSKTTAALQDVLRIYRSRFPLAEIYFFNASVQGEKAPGEIVRAIESANRYSAQGAKPLNVLVITRGGGSYEDLFCFNDERIVRAIAASKIPTVSAVGHEIDVTLADFAADKRSATPSHAAQETVPEALLWIDRLRELEANFVRRIEVKINDTQQRIDTIYSRLVAAAPQKKIEYERNLLNQRYALIRASLLRTLEKRKSELARLSSLLDALSPLRVMDRGYSIVKGPGARALHSVNEVKVGDALQVVLKDGTLAATVSSVAAVSAASASSVASADPA